MKDIIVSKFITLFAILTLSLGVIGYVYAFDIPDLNGTWQPDWSYKATLNLPEKDRDFGNYFLDFSWGKALCIIHTSFDIDITAKGPFFRAPGDGLFQITNIIKITANRIKIFAYHGLDPDNRTFIEIIFHFIDKNTIWIESEFLEDDIGIMYGRGNLWHRLSGPGQ